MRRYMQLAYLFHQYAKSLLSTDGRRAGCTVRHPGVGRPLSSLHQSHLPALGTSSTNWEWTYLFRTRHSDQWHVYLQFYEIKTIDIFAITEVVDLVIRLIILYRGVLSIDYFDQLSHQSSIFVIKRVHNNIPITVLLHRVWFKATILLAIHLWV